MTGAPLLPWGLAPAGLALVGSGRSGSVGEGHQVNPVRTERPATQEPAGGQTEGPPEAVHAEGLNGVIGAARVVTAHRHPARSGALIGPEQEQCTPPRPGLAEFCGGHLKDIVRGAGCCRGRRAGSRGHRPRTACSREARWRACATSARKAAGEAEAEAGENAAGNGPGSGAEPRPGPRRGPVGGGGCARQPSRIGD